MPHFSSQVCKRAIRQRPWTACYLDISHSIVSRSACVVLHGDVESIHSLTAQWRSFMGCGTSVHLCCIVFLHAALNCTFSPKKNKGFLLTYGKTLHLFQEISSCCKKTHETGWDKTERRKYILIVLFSLTSLWNYRRWMRYFSADDQNALCLCDH